MARARNALVLAGGGSRGAYQAGALLGMHAEGCRPDLVVGTSVGAINGAYLLAAKDPRRLAELWVALKQRQVVDFRFDGWRFWTWKAIGRNRPLRHLLSREIDFARLRAGPTPFIVTAVDLCCGQPHAFHQDELTVDHLLASAAIPGIYPPVDIDGHSYVDGAVLQATPLKQAVEAGADEIMAILNVPRGGGPSVAPKNLPQVLMRVTDAQAQYALLHDLRRAEEINNMLTAGVSWGEFRPIRFHLLEPAGTVPPGFLRFAPKRTKDLLDRGFKDGQRFFRDVCRKKARRS